MDVLKNFLQENNHYFSKIIHVTLFIKTNELKESFRFVQRSKDNVIVAVKNSENMKVKSKESMFQFKVEKMTQMI